MTRFLINRSTNKRYARDNRLIVLESHIDGIVWHLDVDLSYPEVVEDFKGSAVRRLKWYMSWV